MALLFMDGFDHYASADIGRKWSGITGAGPSIAPTAGRRSGGAMEVGALGLNAWKTFAASSTVIIGFAMARNAAGATGNAPVLTLAEGANQHVTLGVNSANQLEVRRGSFAGALLGTGSTALAAGAYYYIEVKATIDDAAGVLQVRINGIGEIALTGIDTRNAGSSGTVDTLYLGGIDNTSLPAWFDDLYVLDTTGTQNNDFLGDCRIDTLYPTADGDYTGMTPSTGTAHWSLVDDAAPSTTDYVASQVVGTKDSYVFGDLPSIANSIMAVQVNNAALKDDSGARSVANLVRSGATDATSAAQVLTTALTCYTSIHELDPATGAPWSHASVNAAQFGTVVAA